jgi:hypothetical protein
MSFRMPKNETAQATDSVLRQRALRFAGVRLQSDVNAAHSRPELVRTDAREDRFESRLTSIVVRSTKP